MDGRRAKRTEEHAAERYPHGIRRHQHVHRNRKQPTLIAKPSRPASREAGREEENKMERGKQAGGERRTKARREASPSRRTGQVKHDENMRQSIRHEQVIDIASSGIEHEMTGEREPPPFYHRPPRRFIKLAAHTTPIPVRRAGWRDGERETGLAANRRGKRDAEPGIALSARKRGTGRRGR